MITHWKPNPGPQTEVLTRSETEILYGGARGGGKTDAGIVWMVEPQYIANKLYKGLVIRKNSDDLSDWIARARIMYEPLCVDVTGNPPIIKFRSGAFIRTGHLKDDSAYEKYQGHEYHKILIEELTQIPNLDRYLKLIGSSRTTVKELVPQCFLTANPGGPGHSWVKKRFIDVATNKTYYSEGIVNGKRVIKTRIFIPSRVEDTPQILENDPGYVLYLDSLPEDLRRAWREGDWTVFAGQFFSEWRVKVHVIEPFKVPDEWDKYFAVDWGYDPHPFHVGWYAVTPSTKIVKYRELSGSKCAPRELAQKIIEYSLEDKNIISGVGDTQMWAQNPFQTKADSVNQEVFTDKSIALQMNDVLGTENMIMFKANKSRETGWVNIKTRMKWTGEHLVQGIKLTKEPLFQVFSTCYETIRAYPDQIHDEKKPGDMLKQDGDDPCDTDRYAIMAITDGKLPEPSNTVVQERQEQFNWKHGIEEDFGVKFQWSEPEKEYESLY